MGRSSRQDARRTTGAHGSISAQVRAAKIGFTSRNLDLPGFPTGQAAIPERSTDSCCARTRCVTPLNRHMLAC
jgi:hypothetical protein